jgi:hypothetical protein
MDNSGVDREELKRMSEELARENATLPRTLQKAKLFELILRHSRISVDEDNIFQVRLEEAFFKGRKLMVQQRLDWQWAFEENEFAEDTDYMLDAWRQHGAFHAVPDFGHTSANTPRLLELGFAGLLSRVRQYAAREGLSEKQRTMYEACRITLQACVDYTARLAQAVRPYDEESYRALQQLTVGAPRNTYEALQLLLMYFFLPPCILYART